jgi:hypothetical protein
VGHDRLEPVRDENRIGATGHVDDDHPVDELLVVLGLRWTMGANPGTSFSMRDAREFLGLQRLEFDDLVRSLERDRLRKRGRNLDRYRARAYALGLEGKDLW